VTQNLFALPSANPTGIPSFSPELRVPCRSHAKAGGASRTGKPSYPGKRPPQMRIWGAAFTPLHLTHASTHRNLQTPSPIRTLKRPEGRAPSADPTGMDSLAPARSACRPLPSANPFRHFPSGSNPKRLQSFPQPRVARCELHWQAELPWETVPTNAHPGRGVHAASPPAHPARADILPTPLVYPYVEAT
jgi:hypothetical protein